MGETALFATGMPTFVFEDGVRMLLKELLLLNALRAVSGPVALPGVAVKPEFKVAVVPRRGRDGRTDVPEAESEVSGTLVVVAVRAPPAPDQL